MNESKRGNNLSLLISIEIHFCQWSSDQMSIENHKTIYSISPNNPFETTIK